MPVKNAGKARSRNLLRLIAFADHRAKIRAAWKFAAAAVGLKDYSLGRRHHRRPCITIHSVVISSACARFREIIPLEVPQVAVESIHFSALSCLIRRIAQREHEAKRGGRK